MLEPGSPAAGGIYFLGNISIEDDIDRVSRERFSEDQVGSRKIRIHMMFKTNIFHTQKNFPLKHPKAFTSVTF